MKILILSYGPVPTPQYQTIEGGGMRAWGLAKGLSENGFETTVCVNDNFPQETMEHEGVALSNWGLNDAFAAFLNTFDAVIVSYNMGDLSMFVADKIDTDIVLILDGYVPIYVEVSARDSTDLDTEVANYAVDLMRYNHVLKRGDYLLCANAEQKDFYTGVLFSLGILNPATYRDNRILIVPFGIHQKELKNLGNKSNPYPTIGVKEGSKILLWFGGLYPWFNFSPVLEAVKDIGKNDKNFHFVVVGGKNPFNSHPDFVRQYDTVREKVSEDDVLTRICTFVDWVDYSERLAWFEHADAIISINSLGPENHFSWRTRIMDFVTTGTPLLTNGGDPLSDKLIENGAAIRLDNIDFTVQIMHTLEDPTILKNARKAMKEVADNFHWERVVIPLADILRKNLHPQRKFLDYQKSIGVDLLGDTPALATAPFSPSRLSKARTYYAKARKKGIVRSAKFAVKIGTRVVRSKLKQNKRTHREIFLFTNPIDESGAPLVLMDIAADFSKHDSPNHIHLISPGIKPHLQTSLRKKGYRLDKMALGISGQIIHSQLAIQYDDFVLLNTVALYENYKEYVLDLLEKNQLKQATWFIHEDNPSIRFKEPSEIRRIKRLLKSRKLVVVVPSRQTADDYNSFFETNLIKPIKLRVRRPLTNNSNRSPADFESIRFVVSGSPEDGRKGQLQFLAALQYFEKNIRDRAASYRNYSVDFIAIGEDYISQQVRTVGKAVLGDNYHEHGKIPWEDAMKITAKCNVTVCASLNETFALFVAEGMSYRHAVIRNHSAGWQEQMRDDENGYLFKDDNLVDFAQKLELLLNKKMPNTTLAEFGKKSEEIISDFYDQNYYEQLRK